ncbi:MAG: hypothetical protein RLZZ337_1436, partial [Bacteroidota bacterium]
HYVFTNLHRDKKMSYVPVLEFSVGVPFSLGDKWMLTPSFLAAISYFDRGKLENWGRNSFGGDATLNGNISLAYRLFSHYNSDLSN